MKEGNVEQGYLLLADISGYDAYLTSVELEHARGVLEELLDLLVQQLSPPLTLASIEGDSIFAFTPGSHFPRGQSLVDLIEATYITFRDRTQTIHRNNTCDCRACRNVPSLDLKFLVHFGEYFARRVESGRVELGGLDANLIRQRLLKDQVEASNGQRGYALFTLQSLEKMKVEPGGMQPGDGHYPHLGEIKTAQLDLRSKYDALSESRHAHLSAEEADTITEYEFAPPPFLLWEWLNLPEKRNQWMRWRTWTAGLRPGGRLQRGASNHCAHGLGTIIETVLDWRPYRYFTVRSEQESIRLSMTQTYELVPRPEGSGTRLSLRTRIEKGVPKWLVRQTLKLLLPRLYRGDFELLDRLISQDESSS